MKRWTLSSVLTWIMAVLVIACPGWSGQAVAQEVPFTGVVNQSQTEVRAGAANRYYRVGELNKGQLVRVEEVIVGWYKIVPPEGIHSYISKAFVDAKGDGSAGVVNSDRTEARAADINGPGNSYRVQAILNEGDGVQIVAEEGSHYRIVAPPNSYVYLPPGSVRRALAMEIEAAESQAPAEPPAAEPVEEPEPVVEPEAVPEPAPVPEPAAIQEPEPVQDPEPIAESPQVPVVPAVPEPVEPEPVVEAPAVVPAPVVEPEPVVVDEPEPDDTSEQALQEMLDDPSDKPEPEPEPVVEVKLFTLAELESQMEAMLELPLEDRPLDLMIARYEVLKAAGEMPQADAYRVAIHLTALRYDSEIAKGLNAIAQAREPLAPSDTQTADAVNYDAVGRLLASSVYDGKTLPRMYRLADPATGRAMAYIRPGGSVDTTRFLGKLVGVQGERAYDPALKLNIFTVTRIDTLHAAD
jgi:hypothetical protein